MRRIKPISHEDEVSLVDHLDELRARIVTSLSVFGVALALCFWQNHLLLELAGAALPARPRKADHLRRHRAVHDDRHRLGLRGDHPLAADRPLPALRLPAAGLQQGAAADDPAAAADDPGAVHRRRRLRLLRRPAGGDPVPAQLQRHASSTSRSRPRSTTASSPRPCSPAASSSRSRSAILAVTRLGIVRVQQLNAEPALRLPGLRGHRRGPAGRRSGLDAAGDGAADRPLRAQHRAREDLRHASRFLLERARGVRVLGMDERGPRAGGPLPTAV